VKTLSIEMLTPPRVEILWPKVEPLLKLSCESNEVGAFDIAPYDIYRLAKSEQAVVFAAFENKTLVAVLAFQFHMTNGKKGADVIAMAGKNLLTLKAAFWQPILDWLKANGVEFVDAYARPDLAHVYAKKFGFNKSCTMVRMTFEGDAR